MPVGEADKGIGAEKGTVYYGLQAQTSLMDWWHDPLEKETYKHTGNLNTLLLKPSIMYGVTQKLNLVASTNIGIRKMVWTAGQKSIHHRTESSLTNYKNAQGSILGDTDILLRYLLKNAGDGDGVRIFLGGGLTIPSRSVLTSDPFFLKDKDNMYMESDCPLAGIHLKQLEVDTNISNDEAVHPIELIAKSYKL